MNSERTPPPRSRRFVSVDPACNRARFYLLSLQETLWGEPALVCARERIGGRGRMLTRILGSRQEAEQVLAKAAEQRLKRGYTETAALR